jgi:hypothetical protein
MKNYMEQFRISVVENAAVYTSSTTLSAEKDLKVLKNKLYDTSSSANAFDSLTAGDVVKMSGWEDYKTENNGIFKVAEVDSSGEWVRFDMPLVDCPEDDIPSGGITLLHTPASWTVTGVSVGNAEVMAAVDMDENEAFAAEYFKVTAANTVSSFAEVSNSTDVNTVAVYWADLTAG